MIYPLFLLQIEKCKLQIEQLEQDPGLNLHITAITPHKI